MRGIAGTATPCFASYVVVEGLETIEVSVAVSVFRERGLQIGNRLLRLPATVQQSLPKCCLGRAHLWALFQGSLQV